MKRLSADWLKSVKEEVIEELKTRRGTGESGSLASYLTASWKYEDIPVDGNVLKEEHYSKIVDPLTAINSSTFPDHQDRTFDLDEYTDKLAQYQPVNSQYTGSGHGCEAACTGWCSSGCYGVCTATCGSLCQGTSKASDVTPTVTICSADCNTLCGNIATCNGCGNYCSTSCGGGCSGTCSSCSGTCRNGCADGCEGGCSTACQGCCKDSCTDSCESTSAFSI